MDYFAGAAERVRQAAEQAQAAAADFAKEDGGTLAAMTTGTSMAAPPVLEGKSPEELQRFCQKMIKINKGERFKEIFFFMAVVY
jgi:hypothetical protein